MEITIINGPNLNLLGSREPDIYGYQNFESYLKKLRERFHSMEIHYFQSNSEGELIDKIHETGFNHDGLILNAGGYTHTSVALSDAIAAVRAAVIEVHISNIHAREEFRHKSITGASCIGMISGLGLEGYALALQYFSNLPNR